MNRFYPSRQFGKLLARHYAKRAFIRERKSGSKLASTVGTTKKSNQKIKSTKSKAPTTFHYGNFSGLKERGVGEVESTSKLISKITDFDQLRILPAVRTAVKQIISNESLVRRDETSELKPSPIQIVSIKKLASNLMDPKLQLHAIAAETGSGKTMAYLVPLLDYLKRQETENPDLWETLKSKAIIRSVILVPTHELVDQVYKTVSKAREPLGIHSYKWGSGTPYTDFLDNVKNRIDILVTTPAKLLSLFNIRMISRADKILSQVKFVVLDEADTLMDQSWVEDTHNAIKKMPNTNHIVFCSATIPNEFNKTLERLFPTVVPITTPRLHKLPGSLEFKVIDASLSPYKGSKMKALAQVLYAITNDGTEPKYEKRCIVFVNEKKDVSTLVEKLTTTHGHDCVGLTGNDTVEERSERLEAFVNPPRLLETYETKESYGKPSKEFVIPDSNVLITPTKIKSADVPPARLKVLITTDLMARGLNFQGVRNVILYDVPKTSIDLVHRAGRTGRMKQGGRVFMLIDKSTKSWAKAVPKIIKKNIALS